MLDYKFGDEITLLVQQWLCDQIQQPTLYPPNVVPTFVNLSISNKVSYNRSMELTKWLEFPILQALCIELQLLFPNASKI
jgi:hypothetical protein